MKENKKKIIRAQKPMRLWFKITLWCGALTIAGVVVAAIVMRSQKRNKDEVVDTQFKKGLITRMWVDSAHHDVRMRSPGPPPVWEEAYLPDRWMMEIQDPNTKATRIIEVHPSMFDIYNPSDFIELGDSAKFAEDYAKAMKEQEEIDKAQKMKNPIYYSKGVKK